MVYECVNSYVSIYTSCTLCVCLVRLIAFLWSYWCVLAGGGCCSCLTNQKNKTKQKNTHKGATKEIYRVCSPWREKKKSSFSSSLVLQPNFLSKPPQKCSFWGWCTVTLPGPRTPPGRAGETVHWDTRPSCEGNGWRGKPRSCAGLSPSSAAWAKNGECCACGSLYSARTPEGKPLGTAQSSPRWSALNGLQAIKNKGTITWEMCPPLPGSF